MHLTPLELDGEFRRVSHYFQKFLILLFSLFLACVTALLGTEVVLYSRNTLSRHPQWVNAKKLVGHGLMGSVEAESTRNMLQRNRLNLGVWHGNNEVLFAKKLALGSLSFDFLADGSWLDVIFNKNAKTFSAIRLSATPIVASAYLKGLRDGRFQEKTFLPDLSLTPGWHRARLTFSPLGFELTMDGRRLRTLPEPSLSGQLIGFRSGLNGALIDNVEVTDSRGRIQIREDFRNDAHYGRVVTMLIPAILAAITLTLLRHSKNPAPAAMWIVIAEMAACGVLALWLVFDHFVWSGRYPYAGYIPWGATPHLTMRSFETARTALFDRLDWLDPPPLIRRGQNDILESLAKPRHDRFDLQVVRGGASKRWIGILGDNPSSIASYLRRTRPRPSRTIVLLGTSQAWGAGADTPDDTLHAQLHRRLTRISTGSSDLLLVNASIRGSRSDELFERYYKRISAFKPGLVIVNLSCNDLALTGADFERNLTRLAVFNRSDGARTVFVLEPAQIDLEPTAKIMRNVAKRFGLPCLDLHGYLADPARADSGYLWWDVIHLTSYGQQLAAEFIAREIGLLHDPPRHR